MLGFNIDKTQEDVMNRLHGDKVIWVIILFLSLISIALIYSSSSSLAFKEHTTNFSFLIKQLKFVMLGLVALYICYKIPLRWYRYLATPALIVSILLLALVPVIGQEFNGAKRWLNFGGITFQPTELAKITIVLYLAKILENSSLETFREFFVKILIPVGIVCILIMIGSVSTALFVGILCFLILFISGVKGSHLIKTLGLAGGTLILLFMLHLSFGIFPRMDTATSRIKRFFKSEEVQNTITAEQKQAKADKTFQADMAKIAISSAPILGKGPGKSTQRYVLPHPYSDYIYTIIVEEYGILGGSFVLMLYLWFLYRCIMLMKTCKTVFSSITVGGLGLLITIQALLHILVNVGILPVTGHTLPLVSLGGTSLIILSCAFGIVLAVSRTKESSTSAATQAGIPDATQAGASAAVPAREGNSVAGGGNEQ
jgi:cell division protein FtsW